MYYLNKCEHEKHSVWAVLEDRKKSFWNAHHSNSMLKIDKIMIGRYHFIYIIISGTWSSDAWSNSPKHFAASEQKHKHRTWSQHFHLSKFLFPVEISFSSLLIFQLSPPNNKELCWLTSFTFARKHWVYKPSPDLYNVELSEPEERLNWMCC